MYDYLVVGAGLFGAVFAREMTDRGKKCLVIDKRPHIGGNCYTEQTEGINVHKYGAHIFHTSDSEIWNYVNKYAEFNNFINSPLAVYKGQIYNLPFNMNTFSKMWGIKTPSEAKKIISEQILHSGISSPNNLEEKAISLVGTDIYEKLIKGYTEKQWGRKCKDLPAFIIDRIPIRFTYDNNYFNDIYQGVPIGGYSVIFDKLLDGIEVLLNTDYKQIEKSVDALKTVYSGPIDEYFDYCYGELEYRCVRFEEEILCCENYQGNAVVNYTSSDIPYTRIIEHKHFEYGTQKTTVISREYPAEWHKGMDPYYPVNDKKNMALYSKYRELSALHPDVIFGGRLGRYEYLDMDKVIRAALDAVRDEETGAQEV
ncbi:MAG: UDP-galactopyranose mutase [Eubacteriales bacterium]